MTQIFQVNIISEFYLAHGRGLATSSLYMWSRKFKNFKLGIKASTIYSNMHQKNYNELFNPQKSSFIISTIYTILLFSFISLIF